jgi:putative ABC transport system substrate-binding protein
MDPPVGTFAGSIVEPTDLPTEDILPPTEDILPPILPPTEDILPAWDNIPVRFTPAATDDKIFQARLVAFLQELQQLGWSDGRNIRVDIRWGAGDADLIRKHAVELVALAPDVVMAFTSIAVASLRQVTRAVPIVFAVVADPVGAGYVESLARPGGNVTGFTAFEYVLGGKWLELLKEIAPRVARVAVLRDPVIAGGPGQLGAIQAMAPSLGVELRPVDVADPGEIERALTAFAQRSNGGLIVTGSPGATIHRALIIRFLPCTRNVSSWWRAGSSVTERA